MQLVLDGGEESLRGWVVTVVVDAVRHPPGTFGLNYQESPDNSCLPHQLAGGENVSQVLANGRKIDLEQLSKQILRQPDRRFLVACLDAVASVLHSRRSGTQSWNYNNLRCGSAKEEPVGTEFIII